MSQDEMSTSAGETQQAEAPVETAAVEQPVAAAVRSWTWAKLLLVAVVAAVLGAAASANWHEMPFSFIFVIWEVKAGVMIICSAALGFILGVLFLWSALNRQ